MLHINAAPPIQSWIPCYCWIWNPLQNSEKIACVSQNLMYPIMKKQTYHAIYF